MKSRVALAHRLDRTIRHLAHPQEPLLGDHRLDHSVASRAYADRMLVRLDLLEHTGELEVLDDLLTSFFSRQTAIRTAVLVDPAFAIKNRNELEISRLAENEIERVVRWRDFQCASSKRSINELAPKKRNLAPNQRKTNSRTNIAAIPINQR